MALDATKKWKIKNIRTNADSFILSLLDGPSGLLRQEEIKQTTELSSLFSFADSAFLREKDSALEDFSSTDHVVLGIIIDAITENGFKLYKDTVSLVRNAVSEKYFPENLLEPSPVVSQVEAICTYVSSRTNDVEVMLEQTRNNDVLYAFALCVKSHGDADKIKNETAEMSQQVRRYLYIISGFVSGMSYISGSAKRG